MEWENPWSFIVFHMWLGFMLGFMWHYVWFFSAQGRWAEKAFGD